MNKNSQNNHIVGTEFIGDLKQCNQSELMNLTSTIIKPRITKLIQEYGFTELGSFYYQFNYGVTGVVALAESHVSFHTWPMEEYVSLNVFVCNYSRDNTEKARAIFRDLIRIFNPNKVNEKEIIREFQ